MKLSGSGLLDGSREEVWQIIFDPRALHLLIPGCESLEKVSASEYRGVIRVGVASVAGVYDLSVTVVREDPPRTMEMEGVISGSSGVIFGNASLIFEEEGHLTRINYSANPLITGPLSRVSPRFLEGVVNSLLDLGFRNLNRELQAGKFSNPDHLPLMAE
ncbi:MAG TPA: carbon monoxide dehydrogenase subunit G [Anaerolineales bacterium]|nr:carbon monoxide dehydrogenase subunit G [Anaerolineales bacterium]